MSGVVAFEFHARVYSDSKLTKQLITRSDIFQIFSANLQSGPANRQEGRRRNRFVLNRAANEPIKHVYKSNKIR